MARLDLETRRLGRCGFNVTTLGVGGAWLGNREGIFSEDVAVQTVLTALEAGINLIDTSDNYISGKSEGFVGTALSHWWQQGGRRENLIISTKVSTQPDKPDAFTFDGTMRSVDTSLRALRLDYLDILLVHDPVSLDPVLSEDGALSALLRLKEEGTIRTIGLGCRPHDFRRRCMETGQFDVSLTFGDYNLFTTTAAGGVLQHAMVHDVGVFNASIMANGLLGGGDPANADRRGRSDEEVHLARELWLWCRERGIDVSALNLHYCLREQRFASVLMGFSRPARVEQTLHSYSLSFDESIWNDLARDLPFVNLNP